MTTTGDLVPEQLWQAIQPLLPTPPRRPTPRCRRALRRRGIAPRIARRGIEPRDRLGHHLNRPRGMAQASY